MGIEVKSAEVHRLVSVLKEAGFEVETLHDRGDAVTVKVPMEENCDE